MSNVGGGDVGFGFTITGDASGASNAVAQTNNALGQLQSAVATNWWGLKNLGLAFAALPAAVAGGVGAAVKAASSWQDSMFDVQRTSGATGDELARIESQILDVARATPLATSAIADLAAQGAALGIPNEALGQFASTMGQLIADTNLTAANVNDIARVLNVMQVPTGQFQNFASALIDVGRNTAATETEIVNMARRLAGAGQQAGLTTADVLGISAAVLSLGPRAEAGGSAVQRTLFNMAAALNKGGKQAQAFAQIAGMSLDEFSAAFRDHPAEAFAAFITGLGKVQGGLQGTSGALTAVGITEVRQIQALGALAAGTKNVGSDQTDLNQILKNTNASYQANTTLAEIQAARLKTVSAQLQILKNVIFEAASGFGKTLLGPLTAVVGWLQAFIVGIEQLPDSVKAMIAVFVGVLTVLSAVGAALLLVGPRVLIALGALTQLRNGLSGLITGLGQAQANMYGVATASGVMAAAATGAAGALTVAGRQVGIAVGVTQNSNRELGLINANLAQWQTAAPAAASKFGSAMKGLGAAMAVLSVISAVVAINTARQGQKTLDAAKAAQAAAGPQEALTRIFRLQGTAGGDAAQAWIVTTDAYKNAAIAAHNLGIQEAILLAIIRGTASQSEFQGFLDQISASKKTNSKDTQTLVNNLINLRQQWTSSAEQAGILSDQIKDSSAAMDDQGTQAGQTSKELSDYRNKMQEVAQAHLDYIDAVLADKESEFALEDAEKKLADARDAAARSQEGIAAAERDLTQSRLDAHQALVSVSDAEKTLADAQSKAARKVTDAEGAVLDARDKVANANDNVLKAEQDLADLRNSNYDDKITAAENKLNDARLRVRQSVLDVDALEFHLAQLREEGAGAADIARAELALAQARQEGADATQNASDAQKELEDLKDPVKRAQAEKKAEDALLKARRDLTNATQDEADAERDLDDARARLASGRDVQDAEDALQEARLRSEDANQKVLDSERKLDEERKKNPATDVAKAELEVEQALYRRAQAAVEVKKDEALMRGETWDAQRAAFALAEELDKLSEFAPTDKARESIKSFMQELRNTPAIPPEDSGLGGSFDLGDYAQDQGRIAGDDFLKGLEQAAGKPQKKQGLADAIYNSLGGRAGIGGTIGAIVGGIAGTAIGGPIGTIVGGIVGGIIGSIIGNFWPQIMDFFGRVGSYVATETPKIIDSIGNFFARLPGIIGGALSDAAKAIGGFFEDMLKRAGEWGEEFVGSIFGFFMDLPAKLAYAAGYILGTVVRLFLEMEQKAQEIIPRLIGEVIGFFLGLPDKIWSAIESIPGRVASVWDDIYKAATESVPRIIASVVEFFAELPSKILGALAGLALQLFTGMLSVGTNLWLGFIEDASKLLDWFEHLGEKIERAVKDLPKKIGGWFHDIGKAGWDGFWDAVSGSPRTKFEYTFEDIRDSAKSTVEAMKDTMKELGRMNVDSFGFGGFDPITMAGATADSVAAGLTGGASTAAAVSGGGGDTFQLTAITNADPTSIANKFMWEKRIRSR